MSDEHLQKILDGFCTPAWATTLVAGHIDEFTDLDLRTMQILIDDQIDKRRKASEESAA